VVAVLDDDFPPLIVFLELVFACQLGKEGFEVVECRFIFQPQQLSQREIGAEDALPFEAVLGILDGLVDEKSGHESVLHTEISHFEPLTQIWHHQFAQVLQERPSPLFIPLLSWKSETQPDPELDPVVGPFLRKAHRHEIGVGPKKFSKGFLSCQLLFIFWEVHDDGIYLVRGELGTESPELAEPLPEVGEALVRDADVFGVDEEGSEPPSLQNQAAPFADGVARGVHIDDGRARWALWAQQDIFDGGWVQLGPEPAGVVPSLAALFRLAVVFFLLIGPGHGEGGKYWFG